MTLDILGHANIKVDFGRLSYIISTPQAHRIHHSRNSRHYDRNFGTAFMLWDHVFGTFYYDPKDPAEAFGVDEPIPKSFLKQQVLPLVWMGRALRDSFRPSSGREASN
jgi:sterol desaturase/sphingolipid hydroxylase (fatty acid hydroxylase superfamily)